MGSIVQLLGSVVMSGLPGSIHSSGVDFFSVSLDIPIYVGTATASLI